MVMTLHLDIVSVEEKIYSDLVEHLTVAGQEGGLGIFPGHTPLLTGIKPGEVIITKQGGEKDVFYISGGMLEVQPETATILADTVIRAEDIDQEAAKEAMEKAQANYDNKKKSKADFEKAYIELQEASAKLRAVRDLAKYLNKHSVD